MKILKGGNKTSKVKMNSNLTMNIVVGLITAALAVGIFFTLKNALATEKYYVLNQDVAAKTQVQESMLKEITTSKGSAPQNAISLAQVKQGQIFTKIPLVAGDILSASNTGIGLDASKGIPDDWVVTSFNINADNAAGGNISKGDYFDIIGVNKETGAKYIFHNVLALEVNRSTNNTTVNSEGKTVNLGEQLQYVVGMPADKAPLLHHAIEKYDKVYLAISPISLRYKTRNVQNLNKLFLATNELAPTDLFQGTDNTFTPILRDEKGIPVTRENCSAGLIHPESLCAKLPKEKKTKEKTNNSQPENSTTSNPSQQKENNTNKVNTEKDNTNKNQSEKK